MFEISVDSKMTLLINQNDTTLLPNQQMNVNEMNSSVF